MSRPVSSSMTLSASSRGRVRILYTCGVMFGPMHVGYMSSRSEPRDVRQAFNVRDLEMRPLVITGGKIQKVERAFYLVAGRIAEYKISVDWREFIGLRKKVQDYLHCSMENVEYSDPPPKKPPPLNEPPAILNADLRSDLLYFIHDCHCIVSTVEKIGVAIAIGLPKSLLSGRQSAILPTGADLLIGSCEPELRYSYE
jgi:hypothetical protein